MMAPPAPLYRAIDIPFDDSTTAAYQPPTKNEKSSKDGHFTVILEMGSQPVHKGFGMGVHSERGEPLKVESVLVGTPADRAGLQVGDRITSINGEDVVDAYPSAVNRMLHEAARLGEVELRILRVPTNHYENVALLQKSASAASFDKTRSIFQTADKSTPNAKTPEQRKREAFGSMKSGTLRQDSALSRNSQSSISSTASEHRGLQRSSTGTSSFDPYRAPEIRPKNQSSQIEPGFKKSYGVDGDFRVTTVSAKQGPGRLSDFVPEVERDSHIKDSLHPQHLDEEPRKVEDDSVPRTIRNYDLRPTPAISQSFALRRDGDDASVCAVLKRSTLPRNAGGKAPEEASETDGDFEDGKNILAEGAVRVEAEPRSRRASGSHVMMGRGDGKHQRSVSQESLLTTTEEIYRRYEYRRYTPTYSEPRDYEPRVLDHSPRTRVIPVIRDVRPPSRDEPIYRSSSMREDYPILDEPLMTGRMTPIPIERRYRSRSPESRREARGSLRSRARSTDPELDPLRRSSRASREPIYPPRKHYTTYYESDYDEIDNDGVSRASHRFYDKDGRAVRREERREERMVEVTRSYEHLDQDPREWRQVIKSQRQAAPGQPRDTQRIRDASQSLGNLPIYINKRLKEQEEKDREERKYLESARRDVQEDFRQRNIEKTHERHEPRSYRESNVDDRQPPPPRQYKDWREQERTYNGGPAPDGYSSLHRSYGNEIPADKGRVEHRYGTVPEKPQRQPAQPYQKEREKQEPVVAVSGKHRCGHCSNELGRGQAMIIESLSLYYHLSCFRCYVCGTPLGNGTTGADVRVRDGKLHCYSCYSNDAVQLSKV